MPVLSLRHIQAGGRTMSSAAGSEERARPTGPSFAHGTASPPSSCSGLVGLRTLRSLLVEQTLTSPGCGAADHRFLAADHGRDAGVHSRAPPALRWPHTAAVDPRGHRRRVYRKGLSRLVLVRWSMAATDGRRLRRTGSGPSCVRYSQSNLACPRRGAYLMSASMRSLTFVRVGPVMRRSPRAAKNG